MPSSAGRVRMPHNNRMTTSASLKTSDIWSKTIGYVIIILVVVERDFEHCANLVQSNTSNSNGILTLLIFNQPINEPANLLHHTPQTVMTPTQTKRTLPINRPQKMPPEKLKRPEKSWKQPGLKI